MASPSSRYADYFGSAPDQYGGDCTAAYVEFLPPGPPSEAELFELLGHPDSNGAFAYLGPDTHVHVLHSLRRHAVGSFGQAQSTYAGSTFAIRGERSSAGATFVQVDSALFAAVTADHVRSAVGIAAALAAAPFAPQLDVVTRHGILIPHNYVSTLLQASSTRGNGLEPRELWDIVEGLMAAPEYQAASDLFVDWVWVVISQGAS
jgi:hypothetical protein